MNESVHDKIILKAIFIVGGGASGKSTIAKTMFSGEPVKIIDSDKMVEYKFKKQGVSLDFDKSKEDQYKKQQDIRWEAKLSTDKQIDHVLNGLLPIVIDGTGKRFDRVKAQKTELESLGYDCYLLFVNTPLETAIERNHKRERKVPEDVLTAHWHAVQANLDKFAGEFGQDRFFIVSDTTSKNDLFRLSKKILNSPLQNHVGRKGKEELKKSGGSYLSDLKLKPRLTLTSQE